MNRFFLCIGNGSSVKDKILSRKVEVLKRLPEVYYKPENRKNNAIISTITQPAALHFLITILRKFVK